MLKDHNSKHVHLPEQDEQDDGDEQCWDRGSFLPYPCVVCVHHASGLECLNYRILPLHPEGGSYRTVNVAIL